ncbi:30 kDa spicule matrix protein-like [Diadema antillarum]|uniref:30 kDa spicule matrix protein-like n=1 Tax=Diadema antillarum TaxID=105358 RepID=UPI003A851F0D
MHGGTIQTTSTGTIQVTDSGGLNQTGANIRCQNEKAGASLVTLNSEDENNFLYGWILSGTVDPGHVWLGLHIDASSMTWRWLSGENVTHTNWEDPQATIGPFQEPFGAVIFEASIQNQPQGPNTIDISSQWRMEEARTFRSFVCEYRLPTATNATTNNQGAMLREYNQHPEQRPLNNFAAGIAGLAGSRLHEVVRSQRYRRPPTNRHDHSFAVLP